MRRACRQAVVAARVALRLAGGFLSLAGLAALLPPARQQRLIGHWCHGALGDLGIALRVTGAAAPGNACLVVANHVSWVDILALRAALPCGFVAKHALRGWPVVGRLIALSGGLFLHRERPAALPEAIAGIEARLRAGASVCVFPEATTTTGESVAPFFPAAFEASARCAAPVLPVALRYWRGVRPTARPAWVGEEAFLPSLLRIAGTRRLCVEVIVGEPMGSGRHRAATAACARAAVAALGSLTLSGSPFRHSSGSRVALAQHDPALRQRVAGVLREALARRPAPPGLPLGEVPLAALGIDSLDIVALLTRVEAHAAVELDAAAMELPLDPTVGELLAAVTRCARPAARSVKTLLAVN